MRTSETTETLRHILSIGPRTRRYRHGLDMHTEIMRVISYAATQPGYYTTEQEQALRPAFGAFLAWQKHVEGYRLPGDLIARLQALTPWQLTALIGEMVEAGVTCTGAGERFFADYQKEMAA